MSVETICQSCGMPLGDLHYCGTNVDGTLSEDYCHYCFKDGAFTDQGISRDEKIAKNIDLAVKMGMTKEEASSLVHRVLPYLKRWKG